MAMDGNHAARLNRIQHALRGVINRVAQVEVHTQARGALGLGGQGVEESLGDFHNFPFYIIFTSVLPAKQGILHANDNISS